MRAVTTPFHALTVREKQAKKPILRLWRHNLSEEDAYARLQTPGQFATCASL